MKNGYLKAPNLMKLKNRAPKNLKLELFPGQNRSFGRKTSPSIVWL